MTRSRDLQTHIDSRFDRIEELLMATEQDVQNAVNSLAAAVQTTAQRVQGDIANLQTELSNAGVSSNAALQAVVDSINAQVAALANIDPANPPAPAPPTGQTPGV